MKRSRLLSFLGVGLFLILASLLSACTTQITGGTPPVLNGITPSPSSSGVTATPTPTLINPTSPIKQIRMLDHLKGWALTDQNILFTSDGGQTWKDVTPSGTTLGKYSIAAFRDAQYAWVASTIQPIDNSVTILRTSDGGAHWQTSSIVTSGIALIDYPHFLTTQEGFLEVNIGGGAAGSEAVTIYHTTDSGQTWTSISASGSPHGLPFGGHKNGISFKDVNNGWATGEDASGAPWLYVTHDGGHTWAAQTIPPVATDPTAQVDYVLTPPVFFGNNDFLPVNINGKLSASATSIAHIFAVLKSTDGGATWNFTPSSLTTFATNDLYISSTTDAWASDSTTGEVYSTTNGGTNWNDLGTAPGVFKAFSFVDGSYGWAISDTKLYQTTDGGHHWSEITYHLFA